jgi:wobble nucleotide-excising tRNase
MEVANIILIIVSILSSYLGVAHILDKMKRSSENDRVDQTRENSALELKVKELEGKIQSQYSELSQKISNIEKTLAEDKVSKLTFESRVLSILDKMEAKVDRSQDLLVKVLLNKQQE